MRDQILDQGNPTLRHSAQHTTPRKVRLRAFPTPNHSLRFDRLVSGRVFKSSWMEARTERGGLSDLLTLPSSRSPLRVLDRGSDAERRQSLVAAFSALMEGRDGDQPSVVAWLLGTALAKA